jgi:hypothetical protein
MVALAEAAICDLDHFKAQMADTMALIDLARKNCIIRGCHPERSTAK